MIRKSQAIRSIKNMTMIMMHRLVKLLKLIIMTMTNDGDDVQRSSGVGEGSYARDGWGADWLTPQTRVCDAIPHKVYDAIAYKVYDVTPCKVYDAKPFNAKIRIYHSLDGVYQ